MGTFASAVTKSTEHPTRPKPATSAPSPTIIRSFTPSQVGSSSGASARKAPADRDIRTMIPPGSGSIPPKRKKEQSPEGPDGQAKKARKPAPGGKRGVGGLPRDPVLDVDSSAAESEADSTSSSSASASTSSSSSIPARQSSASAVTRGGAKALASTGHRHTVPKHKKDAKLTPAQQTLEKAIQSIQPIEDIAFSALEKATQYRIRDIERTRIFRDEHGNDRWTIDLRTVNLNADDHTKVRQTENLKYLETLSASMIADPTMENSPLLFAVFVPPGTSETPWELVRNHVANLAGGLHRFTCIMKICPRLRTDYGTNREFHTNFGSSPFHRQVHPLKTLRVLA